MQRCAYVGCAIAAALAAVPSPAGAKRPAPITGTLSRPGYTLIALAADGAATSARATPRRFTLRPPAGRVTLQLRAPDGLYGGPIVVASDHRGSRVILGVRAGARLGTIVVNARQGDGKVARAPRKSWIDPARWARARKGVPIGAGNFGRVRSTPPRVFPVGDRDADGVPDRLDVDVDGNLILNNVERSTPRRAVLAQAAGQLFVSSMLDVPLWETVNADAATATDAAIDSSLSSWDTVVIGILPGDTQLDCGGSPDPNNPQGWIGGLSYCTRGGSGQAQLDGRPGSPFEPFPACCDPDGNGFGTPPNNALNHPTPGVFFFKPKATAAQIGTGDVLIEHATSGGVTTDATAMLPYIFATAPALVGYDDGQGHATTVHYPVQGPPATGPGTPGNGFPVAAGPGGEVALKLTFWRPQRKPIPPESGSWIDIGKLGYGANVQSVGATNLNRACPASAFSTTDPNLSGPTALPQYGLDAGGFTDLAADQPASAANTISYTLNLSSCLAAFGLGWNPGESVIVHFNAVTNAAAGAPASQTGGPIVFDRRG